MGLYDHQNEIHSASPNTFHAVIGASKDLISPGEIIITIALFYNICNDVKLLLLIAISICMYVEAERI